jgi:hypothetical protein
MLCDSNILIYAADPSDTVCGPWVMHRAALIASVTRIEVLGFPKFGLLPSTQQTLLQRLVTSLPEIPLDNDVILRCISLRQAGKIKLADAIIAATALEYGVPLITRNEADFRNIPNLTVINPFTTSP